MFLEHCKIPPKYIVLFKGDDSDFDGNQEIAIDIDTQLSLEGVKAHFRFLDFSQDFDTIPEDRRLLLVFPRESTRKFPLGAMDATLTFEDAQGRTRTVANRIHIVVTNSVGEAYWNEDPQAVTVVMSGDEYLKNAEVSEDGKTLTITKKDGTEVQFRGGGGGGTDDYNDLDNKPRINGHELSGDTSLDDINAQEKLDYNPSTGNFEIAVVEAQHAESAGDAQNAINDILGNNINRTYARKDQSYTRTEIDDKINRFSAHYLTSDAAGHPFATDTALNTAQKFYYAGEEFTPTKNDYCVVLADSGHDGKTTRYSFVGEWGQGGSWQYQYTINDTAFSQKQWAAINSGVTAEKLADIESAFEDIYDQISDIEGSISTLNNGLGEVSEELTKKADKLADTVVAKIEEDRHDDNIMVRIMRVPIEFAKKPFNAVGVTFYQNDDLQSVYMGVGYSTGTGGSSGLVYTDNVVEFSTNAVGKDELGYHVFKFSSEVTSKIPSDAKFLTFFFYNDYIEEIAGLAPIETGYATDEEVTEKKYQIQQSAGFFFVDHAPLIDFLMVNDPVARESILSSDKFKSAVEAVFDDGETEAF